MSWFKNWFNELYPIVYNTRTKEAAEREVRFISAQLPEISTYSCIDLGCGDGRHLNALSRVCRTAVGVDLSADLLSIATTDVLPTPNAALVRADFRDLPFKNCAFDLLTSLFTGFGYLETDKQHIALLMEWRRVLKAGGKFVLDFLDRDFVLSNMVPESIRETCGFQVTERRYLSGDGLRIEKDLQIVETASGKVSHFKESVRAYSQIELSAMLVAAGFSVDMNFSNYDGVPFKKGTGRLIIFSHAA